MKRKISYPRLIILLILWATLTLFLQYFLLDPDAPILPQFLAILIVTGFTALPAYFSSKILVPKFLYHKRIAEFVGLLFATALVNTGITYILAGAFYFEMSGKSIFLSTAHIQLISSFFFITNCLVIIVSSAIQIIVDRFGIEQQLHKVESEKDYTELAFLRAQINPHFLFNVLNTIYFQINMENSEARNSVEKLSEMLRYQLYECTTDMIDISKELAYIRNYVAVQQLRMEHGTDLQLKIAENIGTFKIAPLLILPLVENAFKHLSSFKDPTKNKLHIEIAREQDCTFVVNVVNTFNSGEETLPNQSSSGLGLKNLERRLILLYPGKYTLVRRRNENTYETTLKIQNCD